jgi:hypothetical protein
MTTMFDSLPAALLTLFLAACVLWLVWQAFRRLLAPRSQRLEPSLTDEPGRNRTAPLGSQTVTPVSTIPDAADVLALKAAIDNLARQVAALEKRLAADQTSLSPQPVPSDRIIDQGLEIPSVSPEHRI